MSRMSFRCKSWLVRWIVPALSVFVLVTSLATAGREPKTQTGPVARLRNVPSSKRSLLNPFAGDQRAVAAGRKLFKEHCAECHGEDGRGLGRAADLRSSVIQNAPAGSLFWVLKNGRIRRGMPSWSQLPDQQLWQIVTYLKSFQKHK